MKDDSEGRIRIVRFTPFGSGLVSGVVHCLLILWLWHSPRLLTSVVAGSVYGLLVWNAKKRDD